MDKGQTGCIQLGEFKQVLEEHFHIGDEKAAEMFKSLDINHTQEIHYTEFLAAMCSTRIALHDKLLQETFKRFDTDNSGFITVANLKEVLGDEFNGEDLDKMIKEAGVVHDGKITLQDFKYYMRHPDTHDHHQEAGATIIDKLHENS